jgi:hypothetical protein
VRTLMWGNSSNDARLRIHESNLLKNNPEIKNKDGNN